ncbi:hypothetical protein F1H35_21865 [Salmonella enterica]|nr:hypothetical protein [Salmonella enterica]EGW3200854.1 hypothetical protein [Salmonella enterica subsp. enterica serovar Bovismorbificans]EBS8682505.1 hypothetical protein [Salmonella enterica]ECG9168871.1 hypothetical protein [Salmonella enterica]ECH2755131.1 hypothetical protein [Salmonella enterica]
MYQFSLDLAGCSRTTTDTKKPAGLVPCGLSVLHRTYPDHDLVELAGVEPASEIPTYHFYYNKKSKFLLKTYC